MEKIFCNTRVLNANLTGVQRYTISILNYFPKNEIELIAPTKKNSRGAKGHFWDQFTLPNKINNSLLWSPNNTGPMYYKRQVLTLHDLVHIDYPETLGKMYTRWYNYFLPVLCKSAAHIITISDFSKKRIIEEFKTPEEKITVIYNGVDPIINRQTHIPRYNVPFKRYILSLGSIEPRKNIATLLTAWGNVCDNLPDDIGLVIVGAKGNSNIFKNANLDENVDRVFFTGHINDTHINQLYAEAILFVYLSFYEGFGLPPLEAMAHGIPVITGNRTSLPEVIGDAGLMIDPFSLSECENAIINLVNDESKRKLLGDKGKLRAAKFTWEDAANKTWNILKQY
jgi:glycosyltransferase involved in cell wall biosynthesis